MLTEIWYAHLHTPLFLAGTNLSDKLDTKKRQGLRLVYDWKDKKLLVRWQNQVAIQPESNVASMLPLYPEHFFHQFNGEAPKLAYEVLHHETPQESSSDVKRGPGRPPKTQVSTPTSHVFDGPGKGQS